MGSAPAKLRHDNATRVRGRGIIMKESLGGRERNDERKGTFRTNGGVLDLSIRVDHVSSALLTAHRLVLFSSAALSMRDHRRGYVC
jgi:hypothetical protein